MMAQTSLLAALEIESSVCVTGEYLQSRCV